MLSALSAPVKALKANTSLSADKHAPAADDVGLPVNKLSSAKDFAETLDHAQVKILSAGDAATVKQGFPLDAMQAQTNELVSDHLLSGGFDEVPEPTELTKEAIPAATPLGNGLPDIGKKAPVEVSIQTLQSSSQSHEKAGYVGVASPLDEIRPGSDILSSKESTNRLEAGMRQDAVVRINESLQTSAKANPVMPEGATAGAGGKTTPANAIRPPQMFNNSAGLRSVQIPERSGIAQDNVSMQPLPSENTKAAADASHKAVPVDLMRGPESSKTPDGLNNTSMKSLLSMGREALSETILQTHTVEVRPLGNKTDDSNAGLTDSRPGLEKVESNQLVAGTVKTGYASSATRNPSDTVPIARNDLPGQWMQQKEQKVVTSERIATDPLQTRVDSQPINTTSLMQRQVEQRIANQGSDTKRLQAEVMAALDTRVSTESLDRALITQVKTEAASSVVPKSAGTPALGEPQMNSRQVDTAVQDQILRVMSRQALSQGRLTLQLNPHELGSLDIEFSTEKGEVQVAIVARETSTRDLLEASVARLRQSLQEGGVNVGQLDIRHGDRQSDQQGARESMHQQGVADSSAPGSLREDAVSPSSADEGGIHIYV